MNYKKIIALSLCLSLLVFNLNAQSKIKFGVLAGFNMTKIHNYAIANNASNLLHMGYRVGVMSQFQLSKSIDFSPAIMLNTKGEDYSSGSSNDKLNISYAQLNLPFAYKFNLKNILAYVKIGPYIASAIGGTYKASGANTKTNLKFGSNTTDDFKRFDYGLTSSVGCEYKNFIFEINGDLGFAKIANAATFPNATNNVIGFTVGYLFSLQKNKN